MTMELIDRSKSNRIAYQMMDGVEPGSKIFVRETPVSFPSTCPFHLVLKPYALQIPYMEEDDGNFLSPMKRK
ncbi:hypothetical protein SB89_07985 [Corynebacterium glutamicum]|nr:hypothetical protein SB89_07985 [Corynebacterium glutamicum]OKX91801.1 hypothetical protein AUP72_07485 [Corynebacterium glutamicum]TWS38422.1 hypothetical protein AKJ21_03430 [Corynebacterium glutamicum]